MIVLDCSAVLAILLGQVPASVLDPEETWHAPQLLDVELVSAIRGHLLGGQLTLERARGALADYDDLDIRRWPTSPESGIRSLDLAHNISAYDAAYVVLAEALGATLVTRDRKLAAAASGLVPITVL